MKPALFIKLGGRIFMTRIGGKKKASFIVTPELFRPNKCRGFKDDAMF
jgi:hypothetical protein